MGSGLCTRPTVVGEQDFSVGGDVDITSQVARSSSGRLFPQREASMRSEGECLIFIEAASNVPYADRIRDLTCQAMSSKSHGDHYVKAWAEENGAVIGKSAQWTVQNASDHPSWYSARSLGHSISGLSSSSRKIRLRLELWDKNVLIGSVDVPFGQLPLHQSIDHSLDMRLPMRDGKPCTLSFQVIDSASLLHRRTVFFVRHGESSWNKAQSQMDIYEMGRQTDHPLSEAGRDQAEALNKMIEKAVADPKSVSGAAIAEPDIIYVSPLTRAIQTAIIAICQIQAKKGSCELVLMPQAREKKNTAFSFDSQPSKIGNDIVKRAFDELLLLYKGQEERIIATFKKLKFDTEEVQDQWWFDASAESSKILQARMDDFMSQLLYSPHRTMVVVGHSYFFRAILKQYLSEEFKSKSPQFAADIGSKKLSNCGVVRVDMDPRLVGAPIVDVQLVLGTTLLSEHSKLSCSCDKPPVDPSSEIIQKPPGS